VVVDVFGRTKAGFDCAVAFEPEAVRQRLGLAADDPSWLAELDRHATNGKFVVETDRRHLRIVVTNRESNQ
jgi:hypothetical protein